MNLVKIVLFYSLLIDLEFKNADKILVLDNGSLVEEGTHKELLKREEICCTISNKKMNNIL